MKTISIIIVSWNARSYLRQCLESIRRTGASDGNEIIVVDNASTDGSPELVESEFPEVKLIRTPENLGFARANNLALKIASGSLLALINSDVILHPDCLQTLAAFLDNHPDVGLVGPKVFDRNGQVQHNCGELPTLWNTTCRFLALDRILSHCHIFSGFQLRHFNYNTQSEVELLSGCFWMTRRNAVDEVGPLDERFYFYCEDLDWCKRFRDFGWKLMFIPEASATHFGGGSTANAPLRYSIEILKANSIYWQKHHGNLGAIAFRALATIQHGIRLIVRSFLKCIHPMTNAETGGKLKEHLVCLRWLLTGKGI